MVLVTPLTPLEGVRWIIRSTRSSLLSTTAERLTLKLALRLARAPSSIPSAVASEDGCRRTMVAAGLGEADQQQLIGSTSLSDGLLAVDAGVNGSGLPGEADEVSAGDAGTVRTGSTGRSEVQSLPHPLSPPSTTPNPVPVASTSTSTPSPSSSKPSPTPVLASPAPRKIALLRRPSVSAGAEKEAPEPAERNGVDEVARHAAKLSLSVATDAPSTDELDAGDDEQPPLDKVLRDGLQNPRDRLLLLRAEVEMERFVANSSCVSPPCSLVHYSNADTQALSVTRLPLAPPHFQPGLNSYQRLLIHRLADMFGITREVEAAPPTMWNAGIINPATGQPQGVVVLVKGEATTMCVHGKSLSQKNCSTDALHSQSASQARFLRPRTRPRTFSLSSNSRCRYPQ